MSNEPIIVERTFNAKPEKIWEALTDKNKMKEWYFELKEFKPEPGFEFSFEGTDNDCKTFVHLCKITEVVPNKKLTHSWRYEGYEGNSLVTWELFPEGEKTRVKLTHINLETFPSDVKAFAKENFVAGWTSIVGESLKNYVE